MCEEVEYREKYKFENNKKDETCVFPYIYHKIYIWKICNQKMYVISRDQKNMN